MNDSRSLSTPDSAALGRPSTAKVGAAAAAPTAAIRQTRDDVASSRLTRSDVRNLAIVAHVDHGKTTLVDAMLKQAGAFRANQVIVDRVMDSNDLEREKGITILAKQTAVDYDGVHLNIVDTPGHADFGGEVERSLNMVDSVLLLVDAAEGPLPQTRYVLQKAMSHHLPVVVAINKIDRGDARAAEVLDDVYELFMDLGADGQQIDFPVVYTNAKAGTATMDLATPGTDLRPLFELLIQHTPAPEFEPGHPLQLLVTNLSANDYVGRMAVGRIWNGTIRMGQRIAIVREEDEDTTGAIEPGRVITLTGTVTSLTTARGIERADIEEARPGDIIAVAGIPDVTIGDTITDPADPRPLQRLDLDAPTLSMTFGANTSPLSGREGKYVTSRHIRARLEKEVLGNVSIQFVPTESADTFEVLGRGELQLAILIEQMRREGYEMQVSRPEVILRTIDGETHEPYERITVDIPPEFIGPAQAALNDRKGRLEQMSTDADGRVRMEYVIPVRGLIGFRGQLLTETRGTALMHQIGEGYGPWAGDVTHRTSGVLVADRQGTSNGYALYSLQERSELFIGSGVDVYEGMVIGENARSDDMDVNATKEKKLTNMRTHSHDEAIRLTPPRELTLESAIEFIGADELVEVTPHSIRLRKRTLSAHDRRREAGREYERRLGDKESGR
jgi:GTP-binding protein